MIYRRFTAASTDEALRQLRETLGDDVLVLSTESEPTGGVVITAAVDDDPGALGALGALDTSGATPSDPQAIGASRSDPLLGLDLAMIRTQLDQLGQRMHLMHDVLVDREEADSTLGAEARDLVERLLSSGLGRRLADRIAHSYERELALATSRSEALHASLAEHVAVAPEVDRRRLVAFVGPTGSGKTTTIAKVAARRVLEGGKPPGLVVADNQRVGAVEQLGAYARLLSAPLRVARDVDEMRIALASLADRDMVLVDTAALSSDPAGCAEVKALLAPGGTEMHVSAVVSASCSSRSLERVWPQLAQLRAESCVVTRLDECGDPGTACTWLSEVGLPLSWLGTGQRVPDDIVPASAAGLARWLVDA
jgi:flagellar biosynthesis protein FlhF